MQGRLLAWVLALVGAVWLSTAVLTWFDARHELTELLDSHLAQAAALLVVQQSHDLAEDAHELDTPSLHHYAPKVAFQVFHEGELALRSANAPQAPMLDLREARKQGFQTVTLDGVSWRVFATRGQERDVQVLVGEQIASRDSILWAVLRSTLSPCSWPCRCWRPACGGACGAALRRCGAWARSWLSARRVICMRWTPARRRARCSRC